MCENIRNFSIIAHVDHGKSTLADRMLEMTGTIEKRRMQEQVLDRMELERERGITIKMTPVRMHYELRSDNYVLNLIDTPGHVDFAYEVSRALTAVEGVVLLVDATQGVEAQTLSVLGIARGLGLVIIPVVSKIDAPHARTEDIVSELALLLGCDEASVLRVSGKTGEGVQALLEAVVERVPPPKCVDGANVGEPILRDSASVQRPSASAVQALVFDFDYSDHRGVIVYVRMFGGEITKGDALTFVAARAGFLAAEVGVLTPDERACDALHEGEIGYIVTGIKQPGVASVGDTITTKRTPSSALAGYKQPAPVIWASVYPESQDDFVSLRQALERLRLTDSSLSYEEESSGVMGKGFRCGFLGMLHLEIVIERLRREFNLTLVVTQPTTIYEITRANGAVENIYTPTRFPDLPAGALAKAGDGKMRVREMWARVSLITPPEYVGGISQLLYDHEAFVGDTTTLPDGKLEMHAEMPLRELMRGFFDRLKSVSSGYASLSYDLAGMKDADVVRLDVLVAEESVPAFSRIVSRRRIEIEAEQMVDRLEKLLPRQLFELKIQAKAMGRIVAARRVSALRKDVTGYLYGGDVTRKMKLLEKQKKGKKRMLTRGKVNIPHDVFLKVVRGGE